jgi:hypothetical protein
VLPHRQAVVVVSHDPHDLAPQPRCERLNHGPQLAVGSRLTRIYEVAGEHQRRRNDAGRLDAIKQPLQSGISVNRAVQPLLAGDQVSIRKVEQDMIRPRIFRNPQCRHRTVTSSARCAVRRQAKCAASKLRHGVPLPVADTGWRDTLVGATLVRYHPSGCENAPASPSAKSLASTIQR